MIALSPYYLTENVNSVVFYETDILKYKEQFENYFTKKIKNISKLKVAYDKKFNAVKSKLVESNIALKPIESIIKSNLKSFNSVKTLVPADVIDKLKNIFKEMSEEGIFKSLSKGLIISVIVFVFNLAIFTLFVNVFNTYIAGVILYVFIFPIFEGIARHIAIKSNAAGGFLITFGIVNLLYRAFIIGPLIGIPLSLILISQIVPSIISIFLTVIQRDLYKEGSIESLKLTTILHMFYNFTSTLSLLSGIPFLHLPAIAVISFITGMPRKPNTKKIPG